MNLRPDDVKPVSIAPTQATLKEALTLFLYSNRNRPIPFSELNNRVDGFVGEKCLSSARDNNIVFWAGMSEEAVETLIDLLTVRKIKLIPINEMTYLIDGVFPKIPLAKKLCLYKKPHWVPCAIMVIG